MKKSRVKQNVGIVIGILERVAEHLDVPSGSWKDEIKEDIGQAEETIKRIRKGISPQE